MSGFKTAIQEDTDNAEFLNKLKNDYQNKVVVVDFFATWCGPCKMIAPALEALVRENDEKAHLITVDVDGCEDIAKNAGISAMPTFFFYINGDKVGELMGANKEKLTAIFNEMLSKLS